MGLEGFFDSAKGILASIAPTVATALGGPFAGIATQKLIGVLGLAPESTNEDVMKAVAGATPEQLLAIKKADQEFAAECKRLDIKIMELEANDRINARNREIQTHDSWTPRAIAGSIMLLYVTVQWYVLTQIIDPSMREIVMRSLGTLDAAVGLILGYYFGSSIGSFMKNEALTKRDKELS